jgi:hypothetical protein
MAINLDNLLQEDNKDLVNTEIITETTSTPEVTIPDFESIVTEWSYRCDKGYPDMNDRSDMLHLQTILEEKGIESPFERLTEAPDFISNIDLLKKEGFDKLYNSLPSDDKKTQFIKFIDTIPSALRKEFIKTAKGLSSSEIKEFAKFFKSLDSVEQLNNVSYKPYKKLWDTAVGQAIGNGELFISFAVDKAVVQGSTESFDIDDQGKHYEVKSLWVYDNRENKYKYGQIRPGAEGKVSKYPFTKQLMEFYSLVRKLQDPKIKSNVMSLGSKEAMNKIYSIINEISTIKPKGGDVLESPGDIPTSMMNNVYNSAIELHKIKTVPLKKDITTSRIAVKGSKADSSYWISPEDADEITKSAGSSKEVKIKVGSAVSDESKEGKIILTDLFNHPFVTNPKIFTNSLSAIKDTFFGGKSGLVYFYQEVTYVSKDMSEFATVESSQDGYRFGLKSRNKGKAYIEDQR